MANPTVLIVDDDEDLHVLYSLFRQGASYRILKAYNGKQALEVIEADRPDVIVLDMIMPVMDGEEFLIKLRTEKQITDIPVIIASVNEKIPPRMFELGIFTTLKKPFVIQILVEKIQQAVAQKR